MSAKYNIRTEYYLPNESDNDPENSEDSEDCDTGEDYEVEESKLCDKHEDLFDEEIKNEDDMFDIIGTYYGQCAYCILDGNDWNEEWDSFNEITGRTMDIIYLGYYDMVKHDRNYLDKVDNIVDHDKTAFRNLYNFGVQLAKSGADIGNQLWDITGSRIIGNQFNGPIISRDISNEHNFWKKKRNGCRPNAKYPVPPHMD